MKFQRFLWRIVCDCIVRCVSILCYCAHTHQMGHLMFVCLYPSFSIFIPNMKAQIQLFNRTNCLHQPQRISFITGIFFATVLFAVRIYSHICALSLPNKKLFTQITSFKRWYMAARLNFFSLNGCVFARSSFCFYFFSYLQMNFSKSWYGNREAVNVYQKHSIYDEMKLTKDDTQNVDKYVFFFFQSLWERAKKR